MRNLMDWTLIELEQWMKEHGQPRFRAEQVNRWLQSGTRPEQMNNLPKALRKELARVPFGGARIDEKRVSERDGTVKYLFELDDGNLVEGVLMRYHHGNTLCLSTQVGCTMGCAFCASTLEGRVRNLHAGEMLAQIAAVERDEPHETGRAVTNIVLMGSGEPLDNYDEVLRFVRRATSPDGLNISARNVSLSTCGLVDALKRWTREGPHVTLCISLHAHDDETRSRLMPINRRYPIKEVLDAAREYVAVTGRRVIIEYALISGVNDAERDAQKLAEQLKGLLCHVNLIPLNPVPERKLLGTTRAHANAFQHWLEQHRVSASVRREMGTDIEGACGQLRRRVLEQNREGR